MAKIQIGGKIPPDIFNKMQEIGTSKGMNKTEVLIYILKAGLQNQGNSISLAKDIALDSEDMRKRLALYDNHPFTQQLKSEGIMFGDKEISNIKELFDHLIKIAE